MRIFFEVVYTLDLGERTLHNHSPSRIELCLFTEKKKFKLSTLSTSKLVVMPATENQNQNFYLPFRCIIVFVCTIHERSPLSPMICCSRHFVCACANFFEPFSLQSWLKVLGQFTADDFTGSFSKDQGNASPPPLQSILMKILKKQKQKKKRKQP